ncbi:hypothetical protein [Alkalicoccobacillus murimartini]|uniref:Uncharacterized protein n=1 Tax=Alkalicoccobacillus murimartini TaxID=171685 RepID=A0ABT9YN18_9BACI|nr:hypothetical protein [Alkalicoccobacillus murimartini]MDQ0208875.1 hypothetical protein [Alkalicoccobacillus murimartini]
MEQQKQDKDQALAEKVHQEMVMTLGSKEAELISTRAALSVAQQEINDLRAQLRDKDEKKETGKNK